MFFSDQVGKEFQTFGLLHIFIFIVVIVCIVLIVLFRKRIGNYKHERIMAKAFAVVALLWEFSLYGWKIANGESDLSLILPIGLCAFTLFIGLYGMFFKSKTAFIIGYFWTWSAFAALLFPDIGYSYDRFRFYQYMFGHIGFLLMFVYMMFVYEWYPNFNAFKLSIYTLTVITFILTILSNLTNKNLMYTLSGDGSPFEMFESFGYPLYLTGVVLTTILFMFIWYIPFIIYHKRTKQIEKQKT